MDSALNQPYEHLLNTLAAFAAGTRASIPPGPHAERWSRAAAHLDQQLHRLHSMTAPTSALKQTATHLTQLARTQDGLRLKHSAATPPTELADQRRLVVFAAWQLLQALEHLATLAGAQ